MLSKFESDLTLKIQSTQPSFSLRGIPKPEPAMVKIYVGKLSGDTTDGDLRGLFEQFGTVEEAAIVRNKDIGFVHMPNEQMAMLAVR